MYDARKPDVNHMSYEKLEIFGHKVPQFVSEVALSQAPASLHAICFHLSFLLLYEQLNIDLGDWPSAKNDRFLPLWRV